MSSIQSIMQKAYKSHIVIPAFNIPYIPMMKPVVNALRDTNTYGLITVARLEWLKFAAGSLETVAEAYHKYGDKQVTSLHLDHIPVLDEDWNWVNYRDDIIRAIHAGYSSVMIDGSRLPLGENISAVREIVELAHDAEVPVEAELGAILGHETGEMPDYEELFASGRGFTDPDEAERFLSETEVNWLSVAVGSVHGAITPVARKIKKVSARLHIGRLSEIDSRLGIPLVLHGGSGIAINYLHEAFKHGIAKLNIATDIRQPYEALVQESVEKAQEAVYVRMISIITSLDITGSAIQLLEPTASNTLQKGKRV